MTAEGGINHRRVLSELADYQADSDRPRAHSLGLSEGVAHTIPASIYWPEIE